MARNQFFKINLFITAIQIKITANYFVITGKPILKFTWKYERSRIANIPLRKKIKIRGLTLLNFKADMKT